MFKRANSPPTRVSVLLQDVQTFDDIWDWLNYTVPEIFWVDEPTSPILHTYNQLLGYFSIRVQNCGGRC
jgi:hypothetical protein